VPFYPTVSRIHYLLPVLLLASSAAPAIVIRDDVPDSQYLVSESEFRALVDLPQEGHGVLISKQWIVTVAHAVRSGPVNQVTINGKPRAVAEQLVYPGFKFPSEDLMPMSGDAAPLMAALASMDDIALIKLAEPIEDVEPVVLYRGSNEKGMLVKIYGKGATGNGLAGEYENSPHRGRLRRAFNYIISADGKWLGYRFDSGAKVHPLEGQLGNGDSGGPVLVEIDGVWELAGLADRRFWTGDLASYRRGIYGQLTYQVRISHYASWIDSVMATHK